MSAVPRPREHRRAAVIALLADTLLWRIIASDFCVALGQGTFRPPATTEMADKYFKNVTAMKGIPVDEFMGEMGLFSAALSYCCGEFHVNA